MENETITPSYEDRLAACKQIQLADQIIYVHAMDEARVLSHVWHKIGGNNFKTKIAIPFVPGTKTQATDWPIKNRAKDGQYRKKEMQLTLGKFILNFSPDVKCQVVRMFNKNDFSRLSLSIIWHPSSRLAWGEPYVSPYVGVQVLINDKGVPYAVYSYDPHSGGDIFYEVVEDYDIRKRLQDADKYRILQIIRDLELRAAMAYDSYMIEHYGTHESINFLTSLGL